MEVRQLLWQNFHAFVTASGVRPGCPNPYRASSRARRVTNDPPARAGRPAAGPPGWPTQLGDQRFAGPLPRPGRCPLYVRAQLDTVGLPWTQWDLVRLKATAREAGKAPVTGCFRRW